MSAPGPLPTLPTQTPRPQSNGEREVLRHAATMPNSPKQLLVRLLLLRTPRRHLRRDQIGLGPQDDAVLQHLEAVGGKRRSRRGDVDDDVGGAGRRRPFGGA